MDEITAQHSERIDRGMGLSQSPYDGRTQPRPRTEVRIGLACGHTMVRQVLAGAERTVAVGAGAMCDACRGVGGIVAVAYVKAARSGSRPNGPRLSATCVLTGEEEPVRAARAFVRERCKAWSVTATVAATAQDLANELAANADRHGSGGIELTVELGPDGLTVHVSDDSPLMPRLLPYRPGLTEKGIGLHLVQQLSAAWGFSLDENGQGKRVWATVV